MPRAIGSATSPPRVPTTDANTPESSNQPLEGAFRPPGSCGTGVGAAVGGKGVGAGVGACVSGCGVGASVGGAGVTITTQEPRSSHRSDGDGHASSELESALVKQISSSWSTVCFAAPATQALVLTQPADAHENGATTLICLHTVALCVIG